MIAWRQFVKFCKQPGHNWTAILMINKDVDKDKSLSVHWSLYLVGKIWIIVNFSNVLAINHKSQFLWHWAAHRSPVFSDLWQVDNSPNHQGNLTTKQHRSEAAPGCGVNLLSLPTLPSPGCPPLMSKHFLASPCISYFHFQSFQKWHFTMVVWRSLWPWAIMERYQTSI